jgi:predicted metalloprotease with PDZ domain
MTKIVGAALAVGVSVWAGAALGAEAPLMTVTISPGPMNEAAKAGEVRIVEVIPDLQAAAGAPLFAVQGEDLEVTDGLGLVPRTGEGRSFTPARAVQGDLTVRYRVTVENTPDNGGTTPIRPRLDGHGFSAIGMTMLSVPEIKRPYRVRLVWDLSRMGTGATAVSSFGDGNVEVAAMPLSRLGRVIFMAGELHREPQPPAKGRFSAVWSGDPGFDLRPPMQWTEKLHAWMVDFFRTPNDPAYRVFVRLNGARNPGGGVAFPNSFFATYGPGVTGESMKNILGHEMVHTFTAHDLGKWYDEGNAVYYQVQLPWRAGMVSTEAYLRDINLTAARYYTNAEIDAAEEKIEPNFFKNTWLNTLGYDRGALYFAILNGKIRRASGGKRSLDDLIRVMVRDGKAGDGLGEAAWLDLVVKELGEDGRRLHADMLAGRLMLPEPGDFGPCFTRTTAKFRRFELGFEPKSLVGDVKTIRGLKPDSEAARAGLRDGDVVIYSVAMDSVQGDPTRMLTLKVTRDGKTFPITYLPRGEVVDAYQWARVAGVPDARCVY